MAEATQFFKSFTRQKRVHIPENNFGKGMQYTDTPLITGLNKTLVNFDIKDMGDKLVPRPGIRLTSVGMYGQVIPLTMTPLEYSDNLLIADGRLCTEPDNTMYRQILLGSITEAFTGTKLHKGSLHVATVNPNSLMAVDSIVDSVDSIDMCAEPVASGTDFTTYAVPTEANIHKIPLLDVGNIARHVGVFAYQNQYYCFKHTTTTKKLGYTKLYTVGTSRYTFKQITPRTLTAREAVRWGYNMLSATPYTFVCGVGGGSIQLDGIMPYDKAGTNLLMTPKSNEELMFKCFFTGPASTTYSFKWEWKELASDTWTEIETDTYEIPTANPVPQTCIFAPPVKELLIRVTASTGGSVEQVMTVGFNFRPEDFGSTANVTPVTYDLTKASGLCFWQGRLGFYGMNEDPTLLLLSDPNDPTYVPYPHNAILFNEPVQYAMPFLDNLLVFTTTKLHMVSISPEMEGWVTKTIQGGLYINPWDIHLIKAVKNMVFFKSGNYYYMVVPKANSMTGELVIAPISKPIEYLLDNFADHVQKLAQQVYGYQGTLELVHYYNFLDYEDVHNVYVFQTEKGVYLNLVLLYNSIGRYWRMYTYESQSIYKPFREDATQKGTMMGLTHLIQDYEDPMENPTTDADLIAVQFLNYDPSTLVDQYIPLGWEVGVSTEQELDTLIFPNHQLIDTGYRDQNPDFKKRFREIQFRINNISQRSLKFHTDFAIDGELRRQMAHYITTYAVDEVDPNYGSITVERQLVDALASVLPGSTILGEDDSDLTAWSLDQSAFPELSLWKIRLPVSGKGYAPRLVILSQNNYNFELLNVSWIFRPLYAR